MEAPEAPGAWPIIGHLRVLHQVLGVMADKCGQIFTVPIGTDGMKNIKERNSLVKTREQSFIDVMMTTLEEEKIADYDNHTITKATVLSVLSGEDTTNLTLT
ncbi:hypothetical protein FRX31_020517 [Thalictrum thalictroides]|uniref:Uncharacterized protein n=1 Tax=Thalictrum thalictroides TaxID=46969 RepID=A0A7J6VYX9_THATH|nr:hypothetical protein FRX31_020517 [Thalictrum thalictroides]